MEIPRSILLNLFAALYLSEESSYCKASSLGCCSTSSYSCTLDFHLSDLTFKVITSILVRIAMTLISTILLCLLYLRIESAGLARLGEKVGLCCSVGG